MPLERRAADHLAELVHPEREVALGGDRRVLLAQAAGGGVARVDEQPRRRWPRPTSFIRSKLATGRYTSPRTSSTSGTTVPFGARRRSGHGADRRHVGRDVLADPPVAAGRGLDVAAALVADAHRHAVDLQLAHVAHGLAGQAPGDPLPPRRQLVLGHRVVEAHHRHGVDDRGEQHARRAPDGLAGRVVDRPAPGAPPRARAARARAGRSRRRRSPGRRARGSAGCGRRRARSARRCARRRSRRGHAPPLARSLMLPARNGWRRPAR